MGAARWSCLSLEGRLGDPRRRRRLLQPRHDECPYNSHFGNIRNLYNGSISNYNGFNIIFTQRMQHGISGQVSYTWSHSLDMGLYSTGGGQIVNPYNIRADYGNSSDDIRHRFVGHYVWRMPFFANSTSSFLRTAVGGWSL